MPFVAQSLRTNHGAARAGAWCRSFLGFTLHNKPLLLFCLFLDFNTHAKHSVGVDVLNAQYRLLCSGHIARQKLNTSQITLLNSSNQRRMFSFFWPGDPPLINPASLTVVCPDGGGEQSEESDGGSQPAPPFLRLRSSEAAAAPLTRRHLVELNEDAATAQGRGVKHRHAIVSTLRFNINKEQWGR